MMDSAESVSTLFKFIYTRWRKLPRLIWYDNGCQLDRYIMYRFPWFTRLTKILIDRFHASDHSCSTFYKFNNFPQFHAVNSERAEQSNNLMRLGDLVASISYMTQVNFMFALRYWIYVYNTAGRGFRPVK
jgi:hypothetical protein